MSIPALALSHSFPRPHIHMAIHLQCMLLYTGESWCGGRTTSLYMLHHDFRRWQHHHVWIPSQCHSAVVFTWGGARYSSPRSHCSISGSSSFPCACNNLHGSMLHLLGKKEDCPQELHPRTSDALHRSTRQGAPLTWVC